MSDDDGAQHLKSLKVNWKKIKSSFKRFICQYKSRENLSGCVETSKYASELSSQVTYIFFFVQNLPIG